MFFDMKYFYNTIHTKIWFSGEKFEKFLFEIILFLAWGLIILKISDVLEKIFRPVYLNYLVCFIYFSI